MALSYANLQNETIAAISTGISQAGIGIIRISGPDAIGVAKTLYRNKKGNSDVENWKANTIHFGYIIDPDQAERPVVDEVMVSIMRAPHSYTTEDTIEINCHGGIYLMQRVLKLVLSHGARMAEPGEFTKRAFLGGRIDLSQAEAVMDLIGSRNEFSRKVALDQLEGSVSGKIKELRKDILYELAFIESALDDPENYSLDGYPSKLRSKCVDILEELNHILKNSSEGRILREGIRTVIVGKPNAGKSSLLNYLAGEERAIVTDIAGTTRDTLEESVRIGDLVLDLIDTAGIHDTDDRVERIGVDRAKDAMNHADLILFLIDSSTPLDESDYEIAAMIKDKVKNGVKCICLLNKMDLRAQITERDMATLFPALNDRSLPDHSMTMTVLPISLATMEGLDRFQSLLQELFYHGSIGSKNEVFLSSVREQQEVIAARDSLNLVIRSIDNGLSEDFFSIDLMNAYTELGKVLGESVEDDLVEEIFSKFCLGK